VKVLLLQQCLVWREIKSIEPNRNQTQIKLKMFEALLISETLHSTEQTLQNDDDDDDKR
jgi:hypothetical protein